MALFKFFSRATRTRIVAADAGSLKMRLGVFLNALVLRFSPLGFFLLRRCGCGLRDHRTGGCVTA